VVEILVSSHQDHVTSGPPTTGEEPEAVEPIELDSSALGGSPKKRQHDQLVNESPVKAKEEVTEYSYHAILFIFSIIFKSYDKNLLIHIVNCSQAIAGRYRN